MLEEEIAARRSFWRRQRKREEELSDIESEIVKQLVEDNYVTMEALKEKLYTMSEGEYNQSCQSIG